VPDETKDQLILLTPGTAVTPAATLGKSFTCVSLDLLAFHPYFVDKSSTGHNNGWGKRAGDAASARW